MFTFDAQSYFSSKDRSLPKLCKSLQMSFVSATDTPDKFALPVKFVLDLSDQPHRASGQTYSGAKSFSKSSFDSLAPSSDNHTDLFFVAGSEM